MKVTPERLIDDYLDDALDDAASAELQAWLEADEKNVRQFVLHVYLHRQLRETLLADNIARNLEESGELDANPKPILRPSEGPEARAPRNTVWSYPMLAMLLLVGAFLGSAVTWQAASMLMERGEKVVVANPDRDAPASTPRYVATLVNVTN
jgi:anti-sigma factor RsiW